MRIFVSIETSSQTETMNYTNNILPEIPQWKQLFQLFILSSKSSKLYY